MSREKLSAGIVVKNPLSPVEHPGGMGVNCELFELGVEQFVVSRCGSALSPRPDDTDCPRPRPHLSKIKTASTLHPLRVKDRGSC